MNCGKYNGLNLVVKGQCFRLDQLLDIFKK